MRRLSVLLLSALILFSCHNSRDFEIERAFYKWNGSSYFSNDVKDWENLKVGKIYQKYFEVDYSPVRGNFPFEKNRPYYDASFFNGNISLVPVIFIKNEIFPHNDTKSLDNLADDIVFLIDKFSLNEYSGDKRINYDEIQIDCDWTKSTQNKYFYLLKKIKEKSGKKLSCTLRMYAYAYPDIMGVPPVDKVMLMCYNLIPPLSDHKRNSILDLEEMKKYVRKKTYPVKMDIALPTFYWSLVFKNNQFQGTMDLTSQQLKTFAKEVEPFWYEVQRDTLIGYEQYLQEGDRIKSEEVSKADILKAIDILSGIIKKEGVVTVALFSWKESTLKQYSHEDLDAIYNRFSKN